MRFKSRFWGVYRGVIKMPHIFKFPKGVTKMFLKMWKEECHVQKFKISHHTPEDFTRCCWQRTERVEPMWLAYRTIMFLYFIVSSLYTIFRPVDERPKHMIFLTNWTYQLESVQFSMAFIITVIKFAQERRKAETTHMEFMPWYYKVYWALFTIVLPSSFVVSVVFWACVYDPVLYPADINNVMVHAFNSTLMLLDFWLVGHPLRFLHFYLPSLYAILYVLFSIIYQTSGGTGAKGLIPIYRILDWRKPEKACLTCFFCYFFLVFLHSLFCLLSMLKFWLRKRALDESNGPQR